MSKDWPFKRGGKGCLAWDKVVIWGPATFQPLHITADLSASYGRRSFFPGILVDISCLESFCHTKMQTWRWFTKKFSWFFFFFLRNKTFFQLNLGILFWWVFMGAYGPASEKPQRKAEGKTLFKIFGISSLPRAMLTPGDFTPSHLEGPPLEASQKRAFRPLLRCPFKEPWLQYKVLDKIHWVHGRCPCFGEREDGEITCEAVLINSL